MFSKLTRLPLSTARVFSAPRAARFHRGPSPMHTIIKRVRNGGVAQAGGPSVAAPSRFASAGLTGALACVASRRRRVSAGTAARAGGCVSASGAGVCIRVFCFLTSDIRYRAGRTVAAGGVGLLCWRRGGNDFFRCYCRQFFFSGRPTPGRAVTSGAAAHVLGR